MPICGICFDQFSFEPSYDGTELNSGEPFFATKYTSGIMATKCGHLFHYSCMAAFFTKARSSCPFCNSLIPCGSIIKIYQDWEFEAGAPMLKDSDKTTLTLLKERCDKSELAKEATEQKLKALSGSLKSSQNKVFDLHRQLFEEQNKCNELKSSLDELDLGYKDKHKQLMQALNCLSQISQLTSLPKGTSLFQLTSMHHGFPFSPHLAIVKSIMKLQENYQLEAKLSNELQEKYLLEAEAYRKAREREIILHHLLSKATRKKVAFGTPKKTCDSFFELRQSIFELTKQSGLLPSDG